MLLEDDADRARLGGLCIEGGLEKDACTRRRGVEWSGVAAAMPRR